AFAFSPPTDSPLELDLLHVGKGDPEDVERLEGQVEGRATYARPVDVMRSRKAKNLAKHGAKASLFASHVDHHDGCIISVVHSGDVPPVPTIGLNKTATGIVEEALSKGPSRIRVEVSGETAPSNSGNLIASIEGSSSLPEIVIGGHLDSYDLCEAAMDNGAGAVLILELARIFSALPPPMRTLRFVFFTGEEIATTGSKRYVKDRVTDPEKLGFFFNVDVPVEGGIPSILKTNWESDPAYWKALAEELGHRFPVVDVPPRFSDHAPFANAGVPCIWVQATNTGVRGPASYEHTMLDTTEKVDILELREATMLAARILLRLANSETLPLPERAAAAKA
ncbi:MAG: M28 family peptidase, partial [Planctomycetota bacterium]